MQITVVIPVYNASAHLREAVTSVLAQEQAAEVILVEDGSQDDSLDVARQLENDSSRVRVLQHPGGGNRGAAASRALGIRHARFDVVSFLDADDRMLPGRFDAAAQRLEDPAVDGVYDAVGVFFQTPEAEAWWDEHKSYRIASVRQEVPPEALFLSLISGDNGFFNSDGITVRRSLFDRVGPLESKLVIGEDLYLWLRLAAVGRLVAGNLSTPAAEYRIHEQNSIRNLHGLYDRQRLKMWRMLLKWLRGRDFDRRVQTEVGARVIRDFNLERPTSGSSFASKLRAARVLFMLWRHCPMIHKDERFTWARNNALGLSRLKSRLVSNDS